MTKLEHEPAASEHLPFGVISASCQNEQDGAPRSRRIARDALRLTQTADLGPLPWSIAEIGILGW